MTPGTLHRVDHNTGYTYGPFGSVDLFDWTPTEDVAFNGIETIGVFGAGGSKNTFTVTGNTASNLYLGTGSKADSVTVTPPARPRDAGA